VLNFDSVKEVFRYYNNWKTPGWYFSEFDEFLYTDGTVELKKKFLYRVFVSLWVGLGTVKDFLKFLKNEQHL
jgi:hypothetical protein